MQIASKPLLRIEARAENGITLVPKGPLAPVAKPVIDRINRVFADEKPISSGPDKFIFSTWIPPAPSIAFDRMISAQIGALIGRKIPDQFSIAIIPVSQKATFERFDQFPSSFMILTFQ